MEIKTVKCRKVYNLGNYENIQIELIAEIKKDEDVLEVLEALNKEMDMYALHKKKF